MIYDPNNSPPATIADVLTQCAGYMDAATVGISTGRQTLKSKQLEIKRILEAFPDVHEREPIEKDIEDIELLLFKLQKKCETAAANLRAFSDRIQQ